MNDYIATDFFVQHMQCPREAKMECMLTVRTLAELAFAAREHGLLKMEELIEDHVRFPDPFLRKAVALVNEISNQEQIRKVLYNFILISSGTAANHRFLNNVLIAETMLAISRGDDVEYIFNYLVPSYFGLEYEERVVEIYRSFKQEHFSQQE